MTGIAEHETVDAMHDTATAPPTRFVRRAPSLVGLGFAAFTYWAALQPSLLPRALMFLVVLSALGVVGGYAFGATVSWLVNRLAWVRRHHLSPRVARAIVIAVWLPPLYFTPIAISWQAEQQAELDMPSTLPGTFALIGLTALVSVLLLVIGRSLRLLTAILARWIARVPALRQRVSERPSAASQQTRALRAGVAAVLVVGFVALVSSGFGLLVSSYNGANADASGQSRDRVGANSGGVGSLVAWETLGRQGRAFVANPLSPEQITAVTGEPAINPLRLYVGMDQADTPDARSALAVRELDRSGAWDREYLAIFVVTGTGWVDPNGVNALEIVAGGDIATVAVQYSAVPSWIGFVIDPDTAMAQGASQVNAIVEAWRQRPADERPELVLFGQSLGAFGSQAAWDAEATVDDVVAEIPKVIWIGPPAQSRLWQQWQQNRTSGPAWQPVIGDGTIARVYVTPGELKGGVAATGPAITYAAHANDPVVYWSPDLFFNRPDWVDRPLGPGVDPNLQWYPAITYLSVGFDLIGGGEPPEVGHNYSANIGPAVALTINPDGWTTEKTAALQQALPGLMYPTD